MEKAIEEDEKPFCMIILILIYFQTYVFFSIVEQLRSLSDSEAVGMNEVMHLFYKNLY